MKRLFLIFLSLALLVIVPFLLWGDEFEESMTLEGTVDAMRSWGAWAWAAGIGLLLVDLFLPILGTVVMSALGLVYGWFVGGLIASVGSVGAGLLAYGLARQLGRRAVLWLAGENGLVEGERLFGGEAGGWVVALSRWLPVFPEVVACMAGIARMSFWKFTAALCAGSVPMAFVFAWIGHAGKEMPVLALVCSAGLPPVIWAVVRMIYRKRA